MFAAINSGGLWNFRVSPAAFRAGRKRRKKEWGRRERSAIPLRWYCENLSLSLPFSLTLVPCFRANRLTEDVPLRGVAFPFCLQEMGERFGRLLFKEETCIYFVLLFRWLYCYIVFIILVRRIVIEFLLHFTGMYYSVLIHARLSSRCEDFLKKFFPKSETIPRKSNPRNFDTKNWVE